MLPDVPAVLDSLVRTDPGLHPIIANLDRSLRSRAWDDAKVTAHHGIIPTLEPANLAAMSDRERSVYKLIRAHYLAQFLPPHEYDRTTARLACGGQTLEATGKQIVITGWRQVLTEPEPDKTEGGDEATARSQTLPALSQGAACNVDAVDLKALKTLPPRPYSQGELVKAMKGVARLVSDPRLRQKLKETTGIGTEATRANIIGGLLSRGYLIRKGRAIVASETACTLIDAVPSAIADPGMTAIWEQSLDMIETGQMTLDLFVERQSSWVAQLVEQYRSATLPIKLPPAPACPLCQAPMRQRTGKSGAFWSCRRYPGCTGSAPVETGRQRSTKAASLTGTSRKSR